MINKFWVVASFTIFSGFNLGGAVYNLGGGGWWCIYFWW